MEINEFLGYLFSYGIPLGAVLLVLLIIVTAMGAAVSWPRYIVLGIILIMLLIPEASSYGSLNDENAASSIFWVKGTKSFFFSFLGSLLSANGSGLKNT